MSFPKIPDMNPHIDITFEDAINLLLTSIAMEEMSLSKLMDAETSKILCVLDDCKHKGCGHDECEHDGCGHNDCEHDGCGHDDCGHDGCGHDGCGRNNCSHKACILKDALKINKSVDDTIKNMIKLQMLLQFKLDNITEILPCTSSTTSTSTSTTTTCTKTTTTKTTFSTTTATHTTTCTTCTCTTTTRKDWSCGLTGTGQGCISNCADDFDKFLATLSAYIYCEDNERDKTIYYHVGDEDDGFCMEASGNKLIVRCPEDCSDKMMISGRGYTEKHIQSNPNVFGYVDFILTVCNIAPDEVEFRMEMRSRKNPQLNHDSGFVKVRSQSSNLQLIICC